MATRIEITYTDAEMTVHVTDDTGRDDTATCKRYPDPESAEYVEFADALDRMMHKHRV